MTDIILNMPDDPAAKHLQEILAKHEAWRLGEPGGVRAYLRGAILHGAIGLPIAADAPARLRAVAKAALSSDDALRMTEAHSHFYDADANAKAFLQSVLDTKEVQS